MRETHPEKNCSSAGNSVYAGFLFLCSRNIQEFYSSLRDAPASLEIFFVLNIAISLENMPALKKTMEKVCLTIFL
jgi:hypothetical protein